MRNSVVGFLSCVDCDQGAVLGTQLSIGVAVNAEGCQTGTDSKPPLQRYVPLFSATLQFRGNVAMFVPAGAFSSFFVICNNGACAPSRFPRMQLSLQTKKFRGAWWPSRRAGPFRSSPRRRSSSRRPLATLGPLSLPSCHKRNLANVCLFAVFVSHMYICICTYLHAHIYIYTCIYTCLAYIQLCMCT